MSDAPQAKPHDPATSGFWWMPGGLLAAAGAAIVLWWVWPPNDEVREFGAELAAATPTADAGAESTLDLGSGDSETGAPPPPSNPLSSYVLETDGGLELAGGDATSGSETSDADRAEAGRHHYHRDTAFEWVLRPSHSLGPVADVGVRAFAFVDGGSAGLPLAVDPLVQISESGTIELSGDIGQLGLEPGRYTISLAVGRVDALPVQADEVFAHRADDPPQAWVVRRVELVIAE
ncbi:hypothetical protein [Enhygromyxa salina]|uniref:Uncharacterized protein n=1 Tax=Enhygromyxa salina TaxID=215803 RepID=A0A2S9YWV5_9BACT|nr:hypothetical protein [Enhygromyxa salina]PRQ09578.1 hypothetical protein ENSA7_06350 [Enhygromyxa salina]